MRPLQIIKPWRQQQQQQQQKNAAEVARSGEPGTMTWAMLSVLGGEDIAHNLRRAACIIV
jgi:hypothetical protein